MREPPVQLLRVPGKSTASPTSNGPEPVLSRGGRASSSCSGTNKESSQAPNRRDAPEPPWVPVRVAKDIVEKAYERTDEAQQKIQQQSDSSQSPDTGPTGGITDRPEGSTTIGDEERPSARPLRREE